MTGLSSEDGISITVGQVETTIYDGDTVEDLFQRLNREYPGGIRLSAERTKLVHPDNEHPEIPELGEDVNYDLSNVEEGDELDTVRVHANVRPAYKEVEA